MNETAESMHMIFFQMYGSGLLSSIKKRFMFINKKQKIAEYYREKRKYAYENEIHISVEEISKFQKHHNIVKAVLRADLLFNRQKCVILSDKSTENNHPKIYACTHIGRWDAEHCLLTIKNQAHVFFGDPGGIYRSVNGLLLALNGVIYCETDNKIDRKAAKYTSVDILRHGGNILIYPEGAWNITENEPVMLLYNGAVDMAIKTGADIIPIAMECYGRTYVMNIGKNLSFDPNENYDIVSETDKLRNILATLRWEIWENKGVYKRSRFSSRESAVYQEYVMRGAGANDYSVEKIQRRRYLRDHTW